VRIGNEIVLLTCRRKFLGLIKNELIYLQEWNGIESFAKELAKYIKFYNNDKTKLRQNGTRCNTELYSKFKRVS